MPDEICSLQLSSKRHSPCSSTVGGFRGCLNVNIYDGQQSHCPSSSVPRSQTQSAAFGRHLQAVTRHQVFEFVLGAQRVKGVFLCPLLPILFTLFTKCGCKGARTN